MKILSMPLLRSIFDRFKSKINVYRLVGHFLLNYLCDLTLVFFTGDAQVLQIHHHLVEHCLIEKS